ncbi:MAG TPA: sigma-70 family RNA polymerase sigma factor [Dissulfurispiraceae bacterium]|nr:sigma-70 family RNA polymerase sigma factor [Dissulfurispiraceae bacterium]
MKKDIPDFQHIDDFFRLKIRRYMTHLVGESEAEDLTQEVFIKVYSNIGIFRGDCSLSTWIYKIASNVAIDALRSHIHRQNVLTVAPGEVEAIDEKLLQLTTKKPSAEQTIIKKQMTECIRGYIQRLPENYRTVLVLSDIEEMNIGDIAIILRISLHAAKIRLHRARAALKKDLEAHCNFYRDEQNELACDLKTAIDQLKSS